MEKFKVTNYDGALTPSKYSLVRLQDHFEKTLNDLASIKEITIKDTELGIFSLIKPLAKEGDRLSLSTRVLNVDKNACQL